MPVFCRADPVVGWSPPPLTFESHILFQISISTLHTFLFFFYFSRLLSFLPTEHSVYECSLLIQQKKMRAESQIPRSLIHRIYAPLANEFHFAAPISTSRTNERELVCLSLDSTLEFNLHYPLKNLPIQLCISASNCLIDERCEVFYECCKGFLVPYSFGIKVLTVSVQRAECTWVISHRKVYTLFSISLSTQPRVSNWWRLHLIKSKPQCQNLLLLWTHLRALLQRASRFLSNNAHRIDRIQLYTCYYSLFLNQVYVLLRSGCVILPWRRKRPRAMKMV